MLQGPKNQFLSDSLRIVFGELSENLFGVFMESYPKAIHIFPDSGVRIGYPKISGESECLNSI